MKTTIYGLLGMVKDGKAPKRIKYKNYEYYLYDNKSYLSNDKTRFFDKIYFIDLNDEVEILEEPKGIPEKLHIRDCIDAYSKFDVNDNRKKINEIIDYLESKGE